MDTNLLSTQIVKRKWPNSSLYRKQWQWCVIAVSGDAAGPVLKQMGIFFAKKIYCCSFMRPNCRILPYSSVLVIPFIHLHLKN